MNTKYKIKSCINCSHYRALQQRCLKYDVFISEPKEPCDKWKTRIDYWVIV